MGIASPYPRENIIAGNYILADMQAYLDKRHRQQNKEILIRHSPGIGECFLFLSIQLTEKIKKFSSRACIYALHLLNMCTTECICFCTQDSVSGNSVDLP